MRDQLGLSSVRAQGIMHSISGFAQKMYLFRMNSGLSLASAISFILAASPTYDFAELGFDASKPFRSVGFWYVEHPGPFLLERGNASVFADFRKPPSLWEEDHRCKLLESSKTYFCDRCGKGVKHNGGGKCPYDGAYLNKTWNTEEQRKDPNYRNVTRDALYDGWRRGDFDLTWYCLQCHAKRLGKKDMKEVQHDIGMWQFAAEREEHNRDRKRKGHFR